MQTSFLILIPIVFGVIAADYVGPQNGNGFRNGNGNGNAYGVPTDSITPPQPQGGPYPPSGWKPAGPRLLLPGESRSAQQPIDSGYGRPPPPQYGPVNPAPSGPSIDNQYGPSVGGSGPSNQYIPGTGFGNGNGNGHGNGHGNGNGNGHNGNGNGHNGNGNGHNGNGNGHNGNGNGHNGNGNGFSGNGNGHNGNGNGHNGNGNGHGGNGNGHNGNGNGHTGSGNGHNGSGNGFANGNGNGAANGNGVGGFATAFHGGFPGGLIYPFIQHSVPAVLAFRPGNGGGHGSVYPIYQVPISPSSSGTGIIASSFPTGPGILPVGGANPSFSVSHGTADVGALYPGFQVTGAHDVAGSHPAVVGQGTGLVGHGFGQYYTLLSNHQSQKSLLGLTNGLINQQLQYAPVGNAVFGSGVPLGVF